MGCAVGLKTASRGRWKPLFKTDICLLTEPPCEFSHELGHESSSEKLTLDRQASDPKSNKVEVSVSDPKCNKGGVFKRWLIGVYHKVLSKGSNTARVVPLACPELAVPEKPKEPQESNTAQDSKKGGARICFASVLATEVPPSSYDCIDDEEVDDEMQQPLRRSEQRSSTGFAFKKPPTETFPPKSEEDPDADAASLGSSDAGFSSDSDESLDRLTLKNTELNRGVKAEITAPASAALPLPIPKRGDADSRTSSFASFGESEANTPVAAGSSTVPRRSVDSYGSVSSDSTERSKQRPAAFWDPVPVTLPPMKQADAPVVVTLPPLSGDDADEEPRGNKKHMTKSSFGSSGTED